MVASDDLQGAWFEEYDMKHYSLENKLISYNRSIVERLKNSGEWRTDYQISDILQPYFKEEANTNA